MQHINERPTQPNVFYREGIQLHDLLSAFCSGLSQELSRDDATLFASQCTAMGIGYSALIALYDCHSCAERDDPSGVGILEQLQMQEIALSGLKDTYKAICTFAERLGGLGHDQRIINVSPFVGDCLYMAASGYMWYIRETGKTELTTSVNILTEALKGLGTRWAVASKISAIFD